VSRGCSRPDRVGQPRTDGRLRSGYDVVGCDLLDWRFLDRITEGEHAAHPSVGKLMKRTLLPLQANPNRRFIAASGPAEAAKGSPRISR